jgi:predicted nucleic acid-binding protein
VVIKYLFDSNILIYHFNGKLNQRGTDLLSEGLTGAGAYSIISKIELLGFNQSESDDRQARLLLSSLRELELTSTIAEQTIQIRKTRKLKLPDAVIAATAIVNNLTIITRNTSDFDQIVGLNYINPFA